MSYKINLRPLKLTAEQESAFCIKRILEQCVYMKEVYQRPFSREREKLLKQAAEICVAFAVYNGLIQFFKAVAEGKITKEDIQQQICS